MYLIVMRYLCIFLLPLLAHADLEKIEQLGHRKWKKREAASRELHNGSPKHYAEIVAAADNHADPEIKMRCRALGFSMAGKVPAGFYVKNPKYWNYKIGWLRRNYHKLTFQQTLNIIDKVSTCGDPKIYGKFLLELYEDTHWHNRAHLYHYIGIAAADHKKGKMIFAANNPYLKLLLEQFNGAARNEIRVIMAVSKLNSPEICEVALKQLLRMDNNKEDRTLFINYKDSWEHKDKSLREAYISLLRSIPLKSFSHVADRSPKEEQADIWAYRSKSVRPLKKIFTDLVHELMEKERKDKESEQPAEDMESDPDDD